MAHYADIDFIRMDMSPLAESLERAAHEWIATYGKLLLEIARTNNAAIQARLDRFFYELVADPEDLEELKAVLQVTISVPLLRFSSS